MTDDPIDKVIADVAAQIPDLIPILKAAGVQRELAVALMNVVEACLRLNPKVAWHFGLKKGPLPDGGFDFRDVLARIHESPTEIIDLGVGGWWIFSTTPKGWEPGKASVVHENECAGRSEPVLCVCSPGAVFLPGNSDGGGAR